MKLIEFSVKRPVTTTMFFAALVILGVVSLSRMSMDLFPEISFPTISISTSYSGAGPEEVEQMITIPVERAVATVNRVESITSNSGEERSWVRVNFAWGTDLEAAANDIRSNLDRIRRSLPDGAGTPTVFKFDSNASAILTLGLYGDMDEGALRELAEDTISYQLQRVPGVANVDVRGGRRREIRVNLKQTRLQALGITSEQVVNVIKAENTNLPAGYIESGSGDFLLRTTGEFRDLEEIRNLVVTTRDGVPVYLKDIAEVEEGYETTRSLVRIDGQTGIVLSLQKQANANTVAVADRVYKVLNELNRMHPEIKLRIINDNSTYIRRAVQSVTNAAIAGGVLAALVLLLFLHNFRATVIVSVVMPISILTTFVLAYFGKMTLNTISLGGLALGVGMLVDNSVVVLDNIFRVYHQGGDDIESAAMVGTSEMIPALAASTLTTICVFFPLVYISGRTGIVYKELSYMVIFSLICSFSVAITLIPMLCAKFLKMGDLSDDETNGLRGTLIRWQHRLEDSYQGALKWCLEHKKTVLAGGIVIFLVTLSLWPLLGSELVQTTDEGVITVRLSFPAGTRLEDTDETAVLVEESIRETVPELENMEVSVYSGSASLTLRLRSKDQRKRSTQEVVKELQDRIRIPGVRVRVRERNSMRMLYGGSQDSIQIDIRGYDQETARQIAIMVMDRIAKIPGVTNVSFSREEERPEMNIRIDRKRAADYGVSAAQIANAIQGNVEGKVATVYRKDGEELQVRVNLDESERSSWQDLGKIMVATSGGRVIPLKSLVEVVQGNSPVNIERKDQERNMTVSASISGRDLSGVMADIQQDLSQIDLPPGINLYYAGDYEEQQQATAELLMALTLSLMLVYMVMAAQFESFLDPFIIMFSVPFALTGVILMLFFTDTNINSQVYIGLIILGGVVVNNAIVLISYFRMLMERGNGLISAVLKGGRARLRPIMMTTCTTCLGLLPLALGIGEGAETQTPLARTVIGGLAFASVLTLFLIPVIFTGLEEMRQRFRNRRTYGALALIVMLGLLAGIAMPVRAAEAQKLNLAEAVQMAFQNSEAGKIIRLKRENAESVFRLDQSAKKLKTYLEAESKDSKTSESDNLSVTAEKSVPLKNLIGLKSLTDLANESSKKITLLGLEEEEANLIQTVIFAYQKEILAKKDLELAEEDLERSKKFFDEIMTRAKLGLTSLSEEIGAEARVASAETSVNRCRQLYRLAKIELRQLIGADSEAEFELEPVESILEPGEPDLEIIRRRAWSHRADLKKSEEELFRADNLLKLAKLSQRVGITLNWSVEKEDFEAGLGITNQNQNSSDEWRLTGKISAFPYQEPQRDESNLDTEGTFRLSFKWTLFDGKARRERVKQAELLREQKKAELARLKKSVDYDVETEFYNYQNKLDEVRNGEIQVRSKQIYLEAAEAKLRLGLASVKDVLDAQAEYHQALVDYEKSKSDLYLAEIRLLKVSGMLTPERILTFPTQKY
ncbi:MAG: TolC family protein [Firmicutes bacterium]|nr:TolC family protein [Bacillota bacterium]